MPVRVIKFGATHFGSNSVSPVHSHRSIIWGSWDITLGEAKQRNTPARNKGHTEDAPANQPIVAGVFPQRNVGTLK